MIIGYLKHLKLLNFNYFLRPTAGGPGALGHDIAFQIAPNGRPYTKQGRAQPGRAPCLGGAPRRSSAEPRGPPNTKQHFSKQPSNKGRACTGWLGARTCLNQQLSAFAFKILCRAHFSDLATSTLFLLARLSFLLFL